jgi:hypothetical protein
VLFAIQRRFRAMPFKLKPIEMSALGAHACVLDRQQ